MGSKRTFFANLKMVRVREVHHFLLASLPVMKTGSLRFVGSPLPPPFIKKGLDLGY